MAYGYYRTITIDNTKVPGDLTDHPFLFNTTHNDLRTTGNGGRVTSADGYDIVFSPNSDGSSPYAHEIEQYDAASGKFVAHVKIPAISSSASTVFYIVYGDSGVTTSQENITGVWDTDFKMVQHMNDATTSAILDSTGNSNDGTKKAANEPVEVAAKAGQGQEFDGNDYISLGTWNPSSTDLTLSAWLYVDSIAGSPKILSKRDSWAAANMMWDLTIVDVTSKIVWHQQGHNTPDTIFDYAIPLTTWVHLCVVHDSGTLESLYVNGSLEDTNPPLAVGTDTAANLAIGSTGSLDGQYFDGKMDEIRISNITRSTDYITATYNNQSSPGTFYAFGAEQGTAQSKDVPDTASGAGALAVTVAVEISDSGVGVDSLYAGQVVVTDTGAGAGSLAITVDVAISDTAAGADSLDTAKPIPISDLAVGSESILITVSLSVADSGVGSGVAASSIEITEADTATGSESIVVEVAVPVSDSGAGVDTLAITVVTSLADTAEGTDSLVNDGVVGVIGRGPQDHIHLDTTSAPTQTYHITKWKPISHRMITIEHSVHGGTIAHAVPDLRYRMWEIEMLLTQSELTILRADLAASHLFYFRAIDHSPGHPPEDIIRVYATQMPSEEFIDPLLQKTRVKLVLVEKP